MNRSNSTLSRSAKSDKSKAGGAPTHLNALLEVCEQCIVAYNPNVTTLDGHIPAFCTKNGIDAETDRTFIYQVVYGCVERYFGLVDIISKVYIGLYHRMQSDRNKFVIVAYLAMVRLGDPLTVAQLKKLVTNYLSYNLLMEYLGLMFTPEMFKNHLVDALRAYYGDDYIEYTLYPHIMKHQTQMQALISDFEVEAKGVAARAEAKKQKLLASKKSNTVIQPFKLTRPFPRIVPEPEVLLPFVRPATVKDAATEEILAAIHQYATDGTKASTVPVEKREQMIKEREKIFSPKFAPHLLTLERPNTLPTALAEADARFRKQFMKEERPLMPGEKPPKPKELLTSSLDLSAQPPLDPGVTFEPSSPSKASSMSPPHSAPASTQKRSATKDFQSPNSQKSPGGGVPSPSVPVRMTQAQVLREDLLYRKQYEAAMAEIQKKEIELGDDSAFQAWRKEMEQKDIVERERAIARRKMEMMICDENAKEAKRKEHREKAKAAALDKEVAIVRRGELEQERARELENKQQAAAEMTEQMKQAVVKAKQEFLEKKLKQGAEVKQQQQQNEIRLGQLLHMERVRKQELIAQIRALETERPNGGVYKADYDPNYCPGYGLMNELSLAQLKQRLSEVQADRAAEERERRAAIIASKRELQQDIAARIENIERNRHQIRLERDEKRQERHAERERIAREKAVREEAELIDLQIKLQKKREERRFVEMARKQAEKERKVKAQLLHADKNMMEAKRWKYIDEGIEKATLKAQEIRLVENELNASLLHYEGEQRKLNVEERRIRHEEARQKADETLAEKRIISEEKLKAQQDLIQLSVKEERAHKAEMIKRKLTMVTTLRDQAINNHTM